VNREELGNRGLTEPEVDDIVAFLLTLTAGYEPMASNQGKARMSSRGLSVMSHLSIQAMFQQEPWPRMGVRTTDCGRPG
jgi:hypothetical protein